MFRIVTGSEKIILKKAFNNWGIFHIFNDLNILIKEIDRGNENKKNLINPVRTKGPENIHNSTNNTHHNINKKESTNIINSFIIYEVYLCANKRQSEITIDIQPFSSGINIGIIKKNSKKFIFNLNFAEIILSNRKDLDFPFVCVNKKAENLVVYGRDIMGKAIESYYKKIKENEILLILNSQKELLGIGRSRYTQNLILQSDKITVDNLQDIGTFYMKSERDNTINFKDT